MILHKIPLARRALLNNYEEIISDYGFDSHWWKGKQINLDQQFLTDNISDKPVHSMTRLMIETQRLMAFLDGQSKRPCASVAIMTDAIPLKSGSFTRGLAPTTHPAARFLQYIIKFPRKDGLLKKTFRTAAVSLIRNHLKQSENLIELDQDSKEGSSDTETTIKTPDFCYFGVDLDDSRKDTLYDYLDCMVWPDSGGPSQYLSEIGEVITIGLQGKSGEKGSVIDIPTLIYPGRYSEEVLPYMKWLYDMKITAADLIGKLRIQNFSFSTFEGQDILKVLSATSDYFKTLTGERKNPDLSFEDLTERLNAQDIKLTDDDLDIPSDENLKNTAAYYPASEEYKEAFDLTGLDDVSRELEEAYKSTESTKRSLIEKIDRLNELNQLQSTIFRGGDDLDIWSTLVEGYTRDSPELKPDTLLLGKEMPRLRPYRLSGVILSPLEYCFSVRAGTSIDDVPDLIMLNDESGAESSVSTAATSIDSAATAVSDSINMYDWYFISPLTPTERQEAKYTTHHNHNYIPQITQISVTEVLELAKSGSSSFEGEGVTLIYATEEEAWDDKKNGYIATNYVSNSATATSSATMPLYSTTSVFDTLESNSERIIADNATETDNSEDEEDEKNRTLPKGLVQFLDRDHKALLNSIRSYYDKSANTKIEDNLSYEDKVIREAIFYPATSSTANDTSLDSLPQSSNIIESKPTETREMSMAERLSHIYTEIDSTAQKPKSGAWKSDTLCFIEPTSIQADAPGLNTGVQPAENESTQSDKSIICQDPEPLIDISDMPDLNANEAKQSPSYNATSQPSRPFSYAAVAASKPHTDVRNSTQPETPSSARSDTSAGSKFSNQELVDLVMKDLKPRHSKVFGRKNETDKTLSGVSSKIKSMSSGSENSVNKQAGSRSNNPFGLNKHYDNDKKDSLEKEKK